MDQYNTGPMNTGIKSWPQDDRPREKMVLKGVHALSDAELVAILLRTGSKRRTALGLARDLLQIVDHDLIKLSRLGVKEYMRIPGIGEAKAVTLVAALELGRRRQSTNPLTKPSIHGSGDAADILQPLFADHRHEVFVVLFLNAANQVIHYEMISQGGVKGTFVDPRIVMRKALEQDAVNIILCHNHPSGNLKPSAADKALTKKLYAAASLLDIKIMDHLIVSSRGYLSFVDEGLL